MRIRMEMSPLVARRAPTLLCPCAADGQGRRRLDRKSRDLMGPQMMGLGGNKK